jgi:DamX protein
VTTTTTAPVTETTDTNKPLPPVQRKTPPANAVVITPAPAPAKLPVASSQLPGKPAGNGQPATGNLADKYAAMARDFAAQKGGAYTVQVELVCETASVTRALRDGGTNIWFLPISYRGRSCYRIFWGRYSTRSAAESAVASIPKSLAESKPVVVTIPK